MISDEDILSTYSWLTRDLFKRIIRKDYPHAEVEVVDLSAKAALSPGENYSSTMIRVSVEYIIDGKKVEKRFIIKAAHCTKEVRDMVIEMRLFAREIAMYRDIIPKVEQLLADIGDNSKLAAKCYEVNDDYHEPYIIFEDLTSRNYKNVDRRRGLNEAEFKKALSKIARWHAGTIVLLEETNYKDYPEMKDYDCLLDTDLGLSFTIKPLKAAATFTKTMPGFEYLSEKLAKCIPSILLKIKKLLADESSFIGLVHGDTWMNNILFTHDSNGEPCDALLCDYQGPYRGPVILDVINTLFTSSVETLQDRDWDILVQHYHNERTDILKKLRYSKRIPSLTETQMEFLEKGVFYPGLSLMAIGGRNLESKGEDIRDIALDENNAETNNVKMLANPNCRKTLEFFFDYCDRKGYFDEFSEE